MDLSIDLDLMLPVIAMGGSLLIGVILSFVIPYFNPQVKCSEQTLTALTPVSGPNSSSRFKTKRAESRSVKMKQVMQKLELRIIHLVLMLLCGYIVCGIVYYKMLNGWTITDALYFTVTTFLSIGYGDMSIDTSDQLFTAFFVLLGVGFIGASIGMCMSDEEDTKNKALQKYYQSKDFLGRGGKEKFSIHEWEMRYYQKELLFSVLQLIFIVVIGTTVMCYAEGWTILQGFYWAVVTMTTTGFGDVTPTTNPTKWFCIFYASYGVIQVARSLSFIAQFPILINQIWQEEQLITGYNKMSSMQDLLNEIESSDELRNLGLVNKNTNSLDEAQFILSLLVLLEKVPIEEVKECKRAFENIDADGSGFITRNDFAPDMLVEKLGGHSTSSDEDVTREGTKEAPNPIISTASPEHTTSQQQETDQQKEVENIELEDREEQQTTEIATTDIIEEEQEDTEHEDTENNQESVPSWI